MRTYFTILWSLLTIAISFGQGTKLTEADKKAIRDEARKVVGVQLHDLMNILTMNSVLESQKQLLIYDSYLPSPTQIFYSDKTVIEDDINPDNTVKKAGLDLGVRKYLEDLKLYYQSTAYSINISEVSVGEVEVKEYPFVKVAFKIQFTDKHRQKATKYESVYRVAELRADKPENQWILLITGVRYYTAPVKKQESVAQVANTVKKEDPKPEVAAVSKESKTQATETKIAADQPKTPETGKLTEKVEQKKQEPAIAQNQPKSTPSAKQSVEKEADNLSTDMKGTAVKINAEMASLQAQIKRQKLQAGIFKGLAVAGVIGAAATYLKVSGDYTSYKQTLDDHNRNLESWWNADGNGSNFGSIEDYKAKPESLIKYGSPGIYFVGVGVAAAGVFWALGSQRSKEARSLKKQLEQVRKRMVIIPSWDGRTNHSSISLVYKF